MLQRTHSFTLVAILTVVLAVSPAALAGPPIDETTTRFEEDVYYDFEVWMAEVVTIYGVTIWSQAPSWGKNFTVFQFDTEQERQEFLSGIPDIPGLGSITTWETEEPGPWEHVATFGKRADAEIAVGIILSDIGFYARIQRVKDSSSQLRLP